MFKKKNTAPVSPEEQDDLQYIEDLGHKANLKSGPKKKKKKRLKKLPKILFRFLAILVAGYLVCVYSNNAFISKWRTLYIETAMGTMTHQWLATYFIPHSVVQKVVDNINKNTQEQVTLVSSWEDEVPETEDTESSIQAVEEKVVKTDEEIFFERYWEVDTEEFREFLKEHPEYLKDGYDGIDIEDLSKEYDIQTVNDDTVLALDAVNNLLMIEVRDSEYVGKMVIIKDAAQIDLAKCQNLGEYGDTIDQFGEDNNALLAVNASRFLDDGGVGNGGTVCGSLVIDGVDYGRPHEGTWKYFGMKYDNLFYITNYADATISEYRWAIECLPALVVNGENVVSGDFGMGIQPRTAIGQTRNGDFMILAIDGRQIGYSIGASIYECADLMIEYGCYQAGDVDGGSSTVLWYKGEQISKSCSATGTGRLTPDAVIVRYADDPDVLAQKED